jgi:hypothetical protein
MEEKGSGVKTKETKKKTVEKSAKKPPQVKVNFNYIKSNQFRVIHADGIHGGITPKGNIQMALYSERQPIPQEESYQLLPSGQLGPLVDRKQRNAIIREVEVEVLMDISVAKALKDWLQEHIETSETITKQIKTITEKVEGK